MKKVLIFILLFLSSISSYYAGFQTKIAKLENLKDTVYVPTVDVYNDPEQILLEDPQANLYEVLLFYKVKFPDIAYCIAAKETGWFTSELCVKYNNLFGLYDSVHKRYYHFDNWYESVIAYRDWVENKYDGEDDYYRFLKKLPYSTKKEYVSELKVLVTQFKQMD